MLGPQNEGVATAPGLETLAQREQRRPESGPATCPFCAGEASGFARGRLLGHRDVEYLRCRSCASIFLPDPDWLEEAYSSPISGLDIGLLERCLQLANITDAVLIGERLGGGTCLDFAGGYGTLTRLMRDRGRDFRHYDPLCENIFAKGLEADLERRYDLVTAFEVLEHLHDPVAELGPVAAATDLLLITTQVLPHPAPRPGEWDYYAPETGQHISFATVDGLGALAQRLGYKLTTSGRLVHLLHRRPLRKLTQILLRDDRLAYVAGAARSELGRRRGLTAADARAAAARTTRYLADAGP